VGLRLHGFCHRGGLLRLRDGGVFYVFFNIKFFPWWSGPYSASRNLNCSWRWTNAYEVGQVVTFIKESNVEIYDIELQKTRRDEQVGVVLTLRLPKGESRTALMTRLSEVPCVRTVESV
jgi:putative Mg2+ transporter-C (MgtC) family protein